MKFKFIITFFFSLSIFSNAQTKYFVKFKDNLQKKDCEFLLSESIKEYSQSTTLKKSSTITYNSLSEKFPILNNSLVGIYTLAVSENDSQLLTNLQNNSNVEYVQKMVNYSIDEIPEDSLYNEQWGLKNIKAELAWDLIPKNSKKILLAVIDTGIDYLHPDLANHIYKNDGEIGFDPFGNDKKSNGIDDDQNGFIDDFQGWDFVDKINIYPAELKYDFTDWDNNPNDEHGHGTNIAGVIGAEHNSIGIAGVNSNIEIMNLRAFDKNGNGEEDDAASAIIYAVMMGAKIINMSWGDSEFSQTLKDVIDYANSQGVILVGSSGNSGSDLPHYPSGFSSVISVGAIQENEALASFSNYGSTLDLVAPGAQIITCGLDNTYKTVSGTSVSAPFVSAAASLILSFNNFESAEIKQILKTTAKDLGESGWDEKYGAGSLNLEKAIKLSVPSKVSINFPQNDFHTNVNELTINITCVSAYFKNFELLFGIGYNPESWENIDIPNSQYQIANANIFNFDLSKLIDTVYTIRLLVNTIDNNKLEERSSFILDRTAPEIISHSIFPALLNDTETIQASIVTNETTIAQLFYRPKNSLENFKSIYLDGFSQDIKVTSLNHFGFLPLQEVISGINHEFYFEVTNESGLKTQLKDDGNYFYAENILENNTENTTSQEYNLPSGRIFPDLVSFSGLSNNYILINESSTSADLSIYEVNPDTLKYITSLKNKIPVSVGDFNNDGKTDILNLFVQRGYIETQKSFGSLAFETVFSDTSGTFWPALAEDIDGDLKTEIIVFSSDTTISIWEVQSDFTLNLEQKLTIFSAKQGENNHSIFRNNQIIIGDFDNDQKNEIVAADNYGRLNAFEIESPNSYKNDFILETFYAIESNTLISKGDFNGDGISDIGLLSEFENNEFITPLIYSSVITVKSDTSEILFQNMLLTTENKFISSFDKSYSALKFADVNNDNIDELIVFSNPNSYIFKFSTGKSNLIFYQTNVNSQSIFTGDLDGNQIPDISIPHENNIKFIEFPQEGKLSAPLITDYYSPDSTHNYLEWIGKGFFTKIFRGIDHNNLVIHDSTSLDYYIDSVQSGRTYFYLLEFKDEIQQETSLKSKVIQIFSHAPAVIKTVKPLTSKNIELRFSLPIDNNNLRINNFKIGGTSPNSVSLIDDKTILLSSINDLVNGDHMLAFQNLKDFYNSPIKDSTLSFNLNFNNNDTEELIISSYNIIDNYNLVVNFNFNLDSLTSLNIINYSILPNNLVKQINFMEGKSNSINITTEKPFGSIGREYVLSIKNIYSSIESGYLPISENSGSQIILTSNSANLNDIYVYPNPVKAESQTLTFANLTQFVEIYIFNLEGQLVVKIKEDDGNGGLTWNLLDSSGNLIPSGIYIYRAISVDSQGNKMQEITNKFAVIR